jgi:hypothetical protein
VVYPYSAGMSPPGQVWPPFWMVQRVAGAEQAVCVKQVLSPWRYVS